MVDNVKFQSDGVEESSQEEESILSTEFVLARRPNRLSNWKCTNCFDSNFPELQSHPAQAFVIETQADEVSSESLTKNTLENSDPQLSLSIVVDVTQGVSITAQYSGMESPCVTSGSTSLDRLNCGSEFSAIFNDTATEIIFRRNAVTNNVSVNHFETGQAMSLLPIFLSMVMVIVSLLYWIVNNRIKPPKQTNAQMPTAVATVLKGELSSLQFPSSEFVSESSFNTYSSKSKGEHGDRSPFPINNEAELNFWNIYKQDNSITYAHENSILDDSSVRSRVSACSPTAMAPVTNPLWQPRTGLPSSFENQFRPLSRNIHSNINIDSSFEHMADSVQVDFSNIYSSSDARDMSLLSANEPEALLYPDEHESSCIEGQDRSVCSSDDDDGYGVYGCSQIEEFAYEVNLGRLEAIKEMPSDAETCSNSDSDVSLDEQSRESNSMLSPLSSHDPCEKHDFELESVDSLSATQQEFFPSSSQQPTLQTSPSDVNTVVYASTETVGSSESLSRNFFFNNKATMTPNSSPSKRKDLSIDAKADEEKEEVDGVDKREVEEPLATPTRRPSRRLHLSPFALTSLVPASPSQQPLPPLVSANTVNNSPVRSFPVRPSQSPFQHFRRQYELCFKTITSPNGSVLITPTSTSRTSAAGSSTSRFFAKDIELPHTH
jgi:hypothetical protein